MTGIILLAAHILIINLGSSTATQEDIKTSIASDNSILGASKKIPEL
jgi:hypothetical protein